MTTRKAGASPGCFVLLVVMVAVMVAGDPDPTDDPSCKTSQRALQLKEFIERMLIWDKESLVWRMSNTTVAGLAAEGTPTNAATTRDAIHAALRNRRFLSVGDSVTRNQMLALVSANCNPFYKECIERSSWRLPPADVGTDAMRCQKEDARNRCGETVTVVALPVINVTASSYYRTRTERKSMWGKLTTTPIVRAFLTDLNMTIDSVEASCDSITPFIAAAAQRSAFVVDKENIEYIVGDRPPDSALRFEPAPGHWHHLSRYDAIIVGNGLHCTVRQMKHGRFYNALASWLSRAAEFAPIVWLENPNCLKFTVGTFKSRGRYHTDPTSKINCPILAWHVPAMQSVLLNTVPVGMFISPTRFISGGFDNMIELHGRRPNDDLRRNSTCLMADPLHPSLECAETMNRALIETIYTAVRWNDRDGRRGACPTKVSKDAFAGEPSAVVVDDSGEPPAEDGPASVHEVDDGGPLTSKVEGSSYADVISPLDPPRPPTSSAHGAGSGPPIQTDGPGDVPAPPVFRVRRAIRNPWLQWFDTGTFSAMLVFVMFVLLGRLVLRQNDATT
jgi:hypothetical protein